MLKEREKETVLPYLWRNQKHLLFTGLHFHGLVHLVQSCQNRVRKGQQINVREAANLHKSPTPSRETPSWPAGPSNFVTWANGHRASGIGTMWKSKRLILHKSKPLKQLLPYHFSTRCTPACRSAIKHCHPSNQAPHVLDIELFKGILDWPQEDPLNSC